MTIVFAILFVATFAFAIFLLIRNKRLAAEAARLVNWSQDAVADAQKAADQKVADMQRESQASVAEAQKLIDQQFVEMQQEAERVKTHYETETRKLQDSADALAAKMIRELEPLRRYEKLRDAESEVRRQLADALKDAEQLRAEAENLLENAKTAATNEGALAINRAKEISEQADALLNQATRDAGKIMADAEKRAEKIGGDAYEALRDKHTLEEAVKALWNVTEGYGDRYVIPSHSLLDDLAASFGYTEAGRALQSARAQSRRMVEQKLAASCKYEETDRRDRANRFVVDAFNGRVDAILSRARHDNYGTLEQEIRDSFSLVNLNGLAFHDARILQTYLDARLAELKWAIVVNELAKKQREEQRYLREKLHDEEKARKEYEEKLRQAAKEEEMKRQAVAEAEERFVTASAEQKAHFEKELEKVRADLVEATKKVLTIAQLTKKGHVYVVSNIGSLGEGVFKIGQTRRPDPQDRIDELGGASVPFEFDIHALIESDNAPALEHKIHKHFLSTQVNKMNPRKEFFRIPLAEIRKELESLKQGQDFTLKVWTDKAVATEYKESLDIESDPQKKEKWLGRQKALADRQLRLDTLRIPAAELIGGDGDNEDN